MNRVEGVVWKVYDRKYRGRDSFTIKIDGDDIWYRAGDKRYAGIAESGNRVAFDAEMNADGTSATIKGPVTLAKPASPAANGTPSAGGDRNNSIVYQSSRKDAIELVQLLVASGSLALPKAQKAKVGAIEAAVDRYTALFFDDVGTLGAVVREAESGGESEEPESDEDEGDEDE